MCHHAFLLLGNRCQLGASVISSFVRLSETFYSQLAIQGTALFCNSNYYSYTLTGYLQSFMDVLEPVLKVDSKEIASTFVMLVVEYCHRCLK